MEICDALHQELAAADAHVTPQVSPNGEGILTLELYDDRLRAFAQHQRAISQRAGELLRELPEGEMQRTVQRLSQLHVWHALSAERHAEEFAATRFWENGRRPRPGKTGGQPMRPPRARLGVARGWKRQDRTVRAGAHGAIHQARQAMIATKGR